MKNNAMNSRDIPLKYKIAYAKEALADPRMRGAGLSDDEFKYWEAQAKQVGGIGTNYDYGAAAAPDARGHTGDAGKLPWHPTFSDQSKYAGLAAHGTWTNLRPDNSGDFHLSPGMMRDGDRLWELQSRVNNGQTDGDRYFFPNGRQMTYRKMR